MQSIWIKATISKETTVNETKIESWLKTEEAECRHKLKKALDLITEISEFLQPAQSMPKEELISKLEYLHNIGPIYLKAPDGNTLVITGANVNDDKIFLEWRTV